MRMSIFDNDGFRTSIAGSALVKPRPVSVLMFRLGSWYASTRSREA